MDVKELVKALIDNGVPPGFDIDGNFRIETPSGPLDFEVVLLLDEAERRKEEIVQFLHQSFNDYNPLDWRRREGEGGEWYCDPGWWKKKSYSETCPF